MSKISNQEYLLKEQYKNASNLNARIQLHVRFSTNSYGWHKWVFDQLDIAPESRILELGCGPSFLWFKNIERIPQNWNITLSDLSWGMLQEAQKNLRNSHRHFKFAIFDAQSVPFNDETFDVIIANHMLYHVPDRKKAISEIYRVLRSGGKFYAATNGQNHMREVRELIEKFANRSDETLAAGSESFSLESGFDELVRLFPEVTLNRYDDGLIVTETEPLVAYASPEVW